MLERLSHPCSSASFPVVRRTLSKWHFILTARRKRRCCSFSHYTPYFLLVVCQLSSLLPVDTLVVRQHGRSDSSVVVHDSIDGIQSSFCPSYLSLLLLPLLFRSVPCILSLHHHSWYQWLSLPPNLFVITHITSKYVKWWTSFPHFFI